jgi:hypothetical protein
MLRFLKTVAVMIAAGSVAGSAWAFSLLGPYETWQVERIGYNLAFNADIGGPMNIGEEYRWNIRTITYGFDSSFLNFFGQRGADEVRKAFAVLNSLPPASKMSSNLVEYPLNTRRVNYEASALGITDLKSVVLSVLLEEIGLAPPDRYTWTLRFRDPGPPVTYTVTMRNFDPVTYIYSPYVNGTLYTYQVFEFPAPPVEYADAIEYPMDPLAPNSSAVASATEPLAGAFLPPGEYITGLTRDDVGGLRYLYRKQNYNVENLLAGTVFGSGSPGSPVVTSTNGTGTNTLVDVALRPGVDKLTFVEGKYDSVLGPFITVTNTYVDYYITNSVQFKQYVQRVLTTAPDIVFTAEDLMMDALYLRRTDTAGWTNNAALNGQAVLAGPGIITPSVEITLNKVGPLLIGGAGGVPAFNAWGAFDGTTNPPVVFPDSVSLRDLERRVLGR